MAGAGGAAHQPVSWKSPRVKSVIASRLLWKFRVVERGLMMSPCTHSTHSTRQPLHVSGAAPVGVALLVSPDSEVHTNGACIRTAHAIDAAAPAAAPCHRQGPWCTPGPIQTRWAPPNLGTVDAPASAHLPQLIRARPPCGHACHVRMRSPPIQLRVHQRHGARSAGHSAHSTQHAPRQRACGGREDCARSGGVYSVVRGRRTL